MKVLPLDYKRVERGCRYLQGSFSGYLSAGGKPSWLVPGWQLNIGMIYIDLKNVITTISQFRLAFQLFIHKFFFVLCRHCNIKDRTAWMAVCVSVYLDRFNFNVARRGEEAVYQPACSHCRLWIFNF